MGDTEIDDPHLFSEQPCLYSVKPLNTLRGQYRVSSSYLRSSSGDTGSEGRQRDTEAGRVTPESGSQPPG